MMGLKRLENKTLRQKAYELLKEQMTTAEIFPGQKISLRSLADQLGVSLIPVREALWQLEFEKTVVIESNRQMYVNVIDEKTLAAIPCIRLSLESMAVEMACDLRKDSALPGIQKLLGELHEAMGNAKRYLKKNQEYHYAICALAESPVLLEVVDKLWTRLGPYIYLVAREKQDLLTAMKFHDPMYQALVDRDKEKMVSSLRGDLIAAAEGINKFLNSYGPDPAYILKTLKNPQGVRKGMLAHNFLAAWHQARPRRNRKGFFEHNQIT